MIEDTSLTYHCLLSAPQQFHNMDRNWNNWLWITYLKRYEHGNFIMNEIQTDLFHLFKDTIGSFFYIYSCHFFLFQLLCMTLLRIDRFFKRSSVYLFHHILSSFLPKNWCFCCGLYCSYTSPVQIASTSGPVSCRSVLIVFYQYLDVLCFYVNYE